MARPREFDVDVALEKAMQIFWDKGYEGAGITDLLAAMEIARGSLYKAFEDKKGLFLATLAHYDQKCISPAVQLLADTSISDGAERIHKLFGTIVEVVETQSDRRGCFLCNTAVDQAQLDPEIQKACQAMMNRMVLGFSTALGDRPKILKISKQAIQKKAVTINIAYNGLRVMVKAGYPVAEIRSAIDTALVELDV